MSAKPQSSQLSKKVAFKNIQCLYYSFKKLSVGWTPKQRHTTSFHNFHWIVLFYNGSKYIWILCMKDEIQVKIAWAKMQHWIFKIFSAYNSAKITCNMSIEWKFCDLSEFVQFLKLRLLIKCIDLFNWDPADFEKWADPHKLVHLRSLSSIWKLVWSMTIKSLTI